MAVKSPYAYIVQMNIDGEIKYLYSKRYAVYHYTIASKYSCRDCAYIAFKNSEFYGMDIKPKYLVFEKATRTIIGEKIKSKAN